MLGLEVADDRLDGGTPSPLALLASPSHRALDLHRQPVPKGFQKGRARRRELTPLWIGRNTNLPVGRYLSPISRLLSKKSCRQDSGFRANSLFRPVGLIDPAAPPLVSASISAMSVRDRCGNPAARFCNGRYDALKRLRIRRMVTVSCRRLRTTLMSEWSKGEARGTSQQDRCGLKAQNFGRRSQDFNHQVC